MNRTILLISACLVGPLAAQTVSVIEETGPRGDRINIVYLAEGYTAAESDAFFAEARKLDDYLRDDESWERFSGWMNSYAIMVESAESGTDNPLVGATKDTYFNTSFGGAGQEKLLAIRGDRVFVTQLLVETVSEYDVVVLLVNSSQYHGRWICDYGRRASAGFGEGSGTGAYGLWRDRSFG